MKKIALTTICLGLFALTSFAQVNARRENQQDRIAQGVQSGQLTPGETANLENQERGLNGEVRADKAVNGGKLTAGEKARINRQQHGLSGQIYRDKHNAASDHFGKSEVPVIITIRLQPTDQSFWDTAACQEARFARKGSSCQKCTLVISPLMIRFTSISGIAFCPRSA